MQSGSPVQREAVLEVRFPICGLGELPALGTVENAGQDVIKKQVQGSGHRPCHCTARWPGLRGI